MLGKAPSLTKLTWHDTLLHLPPQPHVTNTRAPLAAIIDEAVEKEAPLYGFEQEYTMLGKNGSIFGWPEVRFVGLSCRWSDLNIRCQHAWCDSCLIDVTQKHIKNTSKNTTYMPSCAPLVFNPRTCFEASTQHFSTFLSFASTPHSHQPSISQHPQHSQHPRHHPGRLPSPPGALLLWCRL